MKSTLIAHFYNESYLLPTWLNHHKTIFDHGILINYNSSDESVQIIKKIVPHWEIVDSVNDFFEASKVDNEVMSIEREIDGIKICLNITEYLLCKDIKSLFNDNINVAFSIERITMVEKWDFLNKFINPVWESRYYGYLGDNQINGLYRYMHTYKDGQYSLGRHSTTLKTDVTKDAIILWFGFSPFNIKMIKRKLQIKFKIPKTDFINNYGRQHYIKFFQLLRQFLSQHKNNKIIDLRNIFNHLLNENSK
jgi:hypothetical protein